MDYRVSSIIGTSIIVNSKYQDWNTVILLVVLIKILVFQGIPDNRGNWIHLVKYQYHSKGFLDWVLGFQLSGKFFGRRPPHNWGHIIHIFRMKSKQCAILSQFSSLVEHLWVRDRINPANYVLTVSHFEAKASGKLGYYSSPNLKCWHLDHSLPAFRLICFLRWHSQSLKGYCMQILLWTDMKYLNESNKNNCIFVIKLWINMYISRRKNILITT